jgi:phosphatidylglycerol:prolipoprotein diacylglycerol transferase
MLPYFEQPSISLGPITITAFGAIVSGAVLAGLEIGRRRFRNRGLDPAHGEALGWYAIVGGFLGAHIFSVLFYFPEKVVANPLVLFKLWEDISSFGSILGGLLAIWLYFGIKAPDVSAEMRRAYLDVVAFTFPFSLAIGRLACSLAHDHPGSLTTFPLAISLESPAAREYISSIYRNADRAAELPAADVMARMGFHDLGWYEFLYLAAVVVPAVLLVNHYRRGDRPAGRFVFLFILLYMPVRFALDFLRVGDALYAGLTPAQWTAIALLGALPVMWFRWRRPTPMTG